MDRELVEYIERNADLVRTALLKQMERILPLLECAYALALICDKKDYLLVMVEECKILIGDIKKEQQEELKD